MAKGGIVVAGFESPYYPSGIPSSTFSHPGYDTTVWECSISPIQAGVVRTCRSPDHWGSRNDAIAKFAANKRRIAGTKREKENWHWVGILLCQRCAEAWCRQHDLQLP